MPSKLKRCHLCERDFPSHILQEMTVGNERGLHYIECCPICALEEMNRVHGMKRTKFDGPIAESLRQEAVRWLKKKESEAKP